MSESIRKKTLYDDNDNRLVAALHAVDVPTDLRTRLERSIQVAMQEQELFEAPELMEKSSVIPKANSPLWNRRNAIAAAMAAGLGGVLFGYRQLTQPISQTQLAECTQSLLEQAKRTAWQSFTAAEIVAIRRSLQDVGFSPQVHNVTLIGFKELKPLRNIQRAMAYDLGNELVLLDLTIERGVQRVSHALIELAGSRSDVVAFAMSREGRTLVLAGPASIGKHILPAQTT